MQIYNLLYEDRIYINDNIYVRIPTVGEIIDDEENYYNLIAMLTGMPIDFMVQLDDIGVDFNLINEYELFLYLFPTIKSSDTSLIFGDLDLSKFVYAENETNGYVELVDPESDIVIDRAIHGQIANNLRLIHNLKKDIRKAGNDAATKYLIERERKKQQRRKNKKESSSLESVIVAMVNTEQYKYDFRTTREISIYQFNECVRQIIQKVDYDNKMIGVYAGTIDVKSLSQDDLNWLKDKK